MGRQRVRATASHGIGNITYLNLRDTRHTGLSGEIASVGDKYVELFISADAISSIFRLMSDPVIGESIRPDIYYGELIGFYVDIPYPYIEQRVRIKEGQLIVTY